MNGVQGWFVPGRHAPMPLQRPAVVRVDTMHADGMHCVPLPNRRHLPAPSQAPSVPQVLESVAWH